MRRWLMVLSVLVLLGGANGCVPGLDDWRVYPILSTNAGPRGEFATDDSLEPPRAVQIGLFPELGLLVSVGLPQWTPTGSEDAGPRLLILAKTENGDAYTVWYPTTEETSGGIRVTLGEDGVRGRESVVYFEGARTWEFALAPAGDPDPRLALSEDRVCEGGVLSRVAVGMQVMSGDYFDDLVYAAAPGGESLGQLPYDESRMTIVTGPVCVGSVAWWQAVQTDGEVQGWIAENEGSAYLIGPAG